MAAYEVKLPLTLYLTGCYIKKRKMAFFRVFGSFLTKVGRFLAVLMTFWSFFAGNKKGTELVKGG